MKTLNLILSSFGLLILALMTPFFSFLAGIVWWVCYVMNAKNFRKSLYFVYMSPTFARTIFKNGEIYFLVRFLGRGYYLFTLKKIKRNKGGEIIDSH